jgi:hypothetical protein
VGRRGSRAPCSIGHQGRGGDRSKPSEAGKAARCGSSRWRRRCVCDTKVKCGGGLKRETQKETDLPICITYIRRLITKYRRLYASTLPPYIPWWCHITDEYKPHIFVGDVASLTNIRGRSKSTHVTFIFIGATTKPTYKPYICWFHVLTNIFTPMNLSLFPIVNSDYEMLRVPCPRSSGLDDEWGRCCIGKRLDNM